MTADQLLEQMLSDTFTKAGCYRRLQELADARDRSLYEAGGAAAPNAPERAELEALKAAIDALPELVLYAPVPLAPERVAEIGQWLRGAAHPRALLDLRIDPAVAGGCALVWRDAYYDFSLAYFIDKHRAELAGALDRLTK